MYACIYARPAQDLTRGDEVTISYGPVASPANSNVNNYYKNNNTHNSNDHKISRESSNSGYIRPHSLENRLDVQTEGYMPVAARQGSLRGQYAFDCACPACQSELRSSSNNNYSSNISWSGNQEGSDKVESSLAPPSDMNNNTKNSNFCNNNHDNNNENNNNANSSSSRSINSSDAGWYACQAADCTGTLMRHTKSAGSNVVKYSPNFYFFRSIVSFLVVQLAFIQVLRCDGCGVEVDGPARARLDSFANKTRAYFQEARTWLEERQDPRQALPLALHSLALAEKLFSAACGVGVRDNALDLLAQIYARLGQYREAAFHLQQTIDLSETRLGTSLAVNLRGFLPRHLLPAQERGKDDSVADEEAEMGTDFSEAFSVRRPAFLEEKKKIYNPRLGRDSIPEDLVLQYFKLAQVMGQLLLDEGSGMDPAERKHARSALQRGRTVQEWYFGPHHAGVTELAQALEAVDRLQSR